MLRSLTSLLSSLLVTGLWAVLPAAADPVVLVETAPVFPTSGFRHAADTGGLLGVGAGVRTPVGRSTHVDWVAVGSGLAFGGSCDGSERCDGSDETIGILSLTAGPRLALVDGGFELFAGARGGLYVPFSGVVTQSSAGFSIEAGFSYELVPRTSAGLFIRREQILEQTPIRPDEDIQFVAAGLTFVHAFAAPQAVSHPRYRP